MFKNKTELFKKREDDYIHFTYSKEKMSYGKNEIKVDDVQSIDISLCCSKGEKGYMFLDDQPFLVII